MSTPRCGSRGGYYELINLDPDVRMQVNKLISACLCSTAWGQAVMGAIINPPRPGEPSYELYNKERSEVVQRLKDKATLVGELFNSVEGVKCNPVMGYVHQMTSVRSRTTGFLGRCTLFPVSICQRRRSNMLNRRSSRRMPSTALNYWRKLASVSCRAAVSSNALKPTIFVRPFFHLWIKWNRWSRNFAHFTWLFWLNGNEFPTSFSIKKKRLQSIQHRCLSSIRSRRESGCVFLPSTFARENVWSSRMAWLCPVTWLVCLLLTNSMEKTINTATSQPVCPRRNTLFTENAIYLHYQRKFVRISPLLSKVAPCGHLSNPLPHDTHAPS